MKGIRWKALDKMCIQRDLHPFNMAFLCKQGWRFSTQPDLLVTRIFRARYFRNSNFLDAMLGSNPSYVWRSVWSSQELVRAGAAVRIGDGQSVSIGDVPWLPDRSNPYVYTVLDESIVLAPVASLLQVGSNSWDIDTARDLFNSRDAELILRLPLVQVQKRDSRQCCFDNEGSYTVKSAYQHLMDSLPNQFGILHGNWSMIWALKVPTKVKLFLGKACHNILPTCDNLRRWVDVQPVSGMPS